MHGRLARGLSRAGVFAAVGLVLGLGGSLASGAVLQIYTDRPSFLAAVGGQPQVDEDFEAAPVGQVPNAGLSLAHFDLVPLYANNNHLRIDPGNGPLSVNGTQYVWADVRAPAASTFQFELTFNEPVYAFGADFFNAVSAAGVRIRDQNSNPLVDFAQDWVVIGTGFFGFTLTSPVTGLRFLEGTRGELVETFGMDNVVLALPEPAAALLLLAGAIALPLRRRR